MIVFTDLKLLIGRSDKRSRRSIIQMILISQRLCLLISNTSLVGVITVLTINNTNDYHESTIVFTDLKHLIGWNDNRPDDQ